MTATWARVLTSWTGSDLNPVRLCKQAYSRLVSTRILQYSRPYCKFHDIAAILDLAPLPL